MTRDAEGPIQLVVEVVRYRHSLDDWRSIHQVIMLNVHPAQGSLAEAFGDVIMGQIVDPSGYSTDSTQVIDAARVVSRELV